MALATAITTYVENAKPPEVCFVGIQCLPQGNIQRSGNDYDVFLPVMDTTMNLVANLDDVLVISESRNSSNFENNILPIKEIFKGGLTGTISGANYPQQVVQGFRPRIRKIFGSTQPFDVGPVPIQNFLVITLKARPGENLPVGPYNATYLNFTKCPS